jgi:hypothetical protein
MAEVDAGLLAVAGLSSAKAAHILSRSRQTVSRGLRQSGHRYFKADDIAQIYDAVLRDRPDLAPRLLEFVQAQYDALSHRIEVPGPELAFKRRAETARKIWLILPQFRSVQQDIWPELRPLFFDGERAINVFVDDRVSSLAFEACLASKLTNQEKQLRPAVVDLWQPIPYLSLLYRMAIIDPQTPKSTAVFNWKQGSFEQTDDEDAQRIGTAFIHHVCDLQPVQDSIKLLRLEPGEPAMEPPKPLSQAEAVRRLVTDDLI